MKESVLEKRRKRSATDDEKQKSFFLFFSLSLTLDLATLDTAKPPPRTHPHVIDALDREQR
jgi:hypothetical protein